MKLKYMFEVAITIAMTVGMLNIADRILEYKGAYYKYAPFYEEENNYDVLLFGTSHVLNGIFPMELWEKYGIVSYNMGGHNNSLAVDYWIMKNALKETTPKVVLIDTFGIENDVKVAESDIALQHISLDHIPLSRTKHEAIQDLFGDYKYNLEFYWPFIANHGRWESLSDWDFSKVPTTEKGAEMRIGIGHPNKYDLIPVDQKEEVDTVSSQYLCRMIEELQAKDIKVILTYLPISNHPMYQKIANGVARIAEKYHVEYINFMNMNVIDYATDFFDDSDHLNPSGARKISDYLGKLIRDVYGVEDHREDEMYEKWHRDYEKYLREKEKKLIEQEELDVILMLLSDTDFSANITVAEQAEILKNTEIQRLIDNMSDNSFVTYVDENVNFQIEIVNSRSRQPVMIKEF